MGKKGATGTQLEQELSTLQVLFLMLNKLLQTLLPKEIMHMIKVKIRIMPQKISFLPTP